jgi:hypothetical protein
MGRSLPRAAHISQIAMLHGHIEERVDWISPLGLSTHALMLPVNKTPSMYENALARVSRHYVRGPKCRGFDGDCHG